MRNSVLERPDASGSGIVGLQYHDSENYNASSAPEGHGTGATNRQRLDSTITIATEIIRSLEVSDMTDGERKEVVKAVQEAIQKTIETDNLWTQAVEYTQHWSESSFRDGFTTSVENVLHGTMGEKPMFDRILQADEDVDLAWMKVKALEKNAGGQVHKLADVITESLDDKGTHFFAKALVIDAQAPAFQKGLEHFSNE